MAFESGGEYIRGELAPLVGVENLRGPETVNPFSQSFRAKFRAQSVGQASRHNLAAVQVDDGYEVGNVGSPCLVGMLDLNVFQKEGVDVISWLGQRSAGFSIDDLQSHASHQPTNFFTTNAETTLYQGISSTRLGRGSQRLRPRRIPRVHLRRRKPACYHHHHL